MFYEFKRKNGWRFLINFESGWEITERPSPEPALWSNDQQCRNMDCQDSYETIRERLIPSTKEV